MEIESAAKTVLIVSYMFPPMSGVGVIRPLKFARYLPQFGWRPLVLTVRQGFDWSSTTDTALLGQLSPEVEIFRSRSIEPPYRAVTELTGAPSGQKPTLRKRLLRALRTALLIPDDKIGWLPFALREGRQILRRYPVDVVFATAPPPTTLLVGTCLSRWGRCPLVSDFRDPWTQHLLHHWLGNPIRRWIEERLEHAVLRRSSRVVAVTPPRTDALAAKYPDIPRDRFVTITNGFDLDDYGPPAPPPHNERFTLVYTGSFYYRRQPDALFQALTGIARDRPELRDQFRVRLAGVADSDLAAQVARWGLEDVVDLLGPVPYRESVALQKGADLLLLFIGASPMGATWYPAKVFEYIATGRPILALTPEGVAADLVREAGTGVVVPPEDPVAIRRALLDLHARWQEERMPGLTDPAFPLRFERRALTERLADLFEAALSERAAGRPR